MSIAELSRHYCTGPCSREDVAFGGGCRCPASDAIREAYAGRFALLLQATEREGRGAYHVVIAADSCQLVIEERYAIAHEQLQATAEGFHGRLCIVYVVAPNDPPVFHIDV